MAVDERQYQAQRRGGTHRENFTRLQSEFHKILDDGSVSVRGFHQMMGQLLKSFENLRLESEKQIRRLQDELNFNQGTANACATFSNILVSLIESYNNNGLLGGVSKNETKEDNVEKENTSEDDNDGIGGNGESKDIEVVTDVEMLEKVCASCGCQDEIDMKQCDCSCHKGKHCGNENCVICDNLDNYKLKKKRRGRPKKDESIKG